jgi:hypothetical protein
MDSYKAMLFLHILAVVLGLGVTFVYPFLQGFAERKGVAATRFALQFVRRLERMVVWPGAALALLFGLALIFSDQTGYKDDFPAWLVFAILWFAALVGLDIFVQDRSVAAALEALEGAPDDGDLPALYLPIGRRIQMVGGLMGLSIVGILFLMVWKPGE